MIRSKEHIILFFQTLLNEGILFHPDKDFNNYFINNTELKRYTDSEIFLRNKILIECFEFCKKNNIDIYHLYRDTCLKLDVEQRLKEYFPILFDLLDGQRIDWKSINRKFGEVFAKREKNFNNDITDKVQANFYDIISESLNENKQAIRMLNFFRTLLQDLNRVLSIDDKLKIKKTLFNLLIEFDLNYLNYIAELAVLYTFINSKQYHLNRIESPLGNNSKIDFLLDKSDGTGSVLVEVVSIRPMNFPNTTFEIKKMLEEKLGDKIHLKTKGSVEYLKFFLVPVVWGSAEDLKNVANFFKNGNKINIPNVTELLAYCTFSSEDSTIT
jgi:hypothetical protein